MEILNPITICNPFAVIDSNFQIMDCNESFTEKFFLEKGESVLDAFSGTDSLQLIYNFIHSELKSFRFEHLLPTGSWFTVYVEKMTIYEKDLSIISFFHSNENKFIESKLNNFHNLIEYGGIPVAVTNDKFKFKYISKSFEDIFETSIDKIYQLSIFTWFEKYISQDEISEMNSFLEMHRFWKKVISLRTNEFFELKFIPVEDKVFNFTYYIIAANDVTPHLRYQKQLQEAYKKELYLNKLKTAFLENMSHEIRTPLNAIIGYSELINDCIETDNYIEIKEITDSIGEVLKRILNLFSNIVEFSQIESGEINFEKDEINIHSVMRGVILKKEKDANSKGLKLCYFNTDESMIIYSDWIKIEKIFLELLDNSIKYTERGEIVIKVEKLGKQAHIILIDTGKGMSEIEIERLLQPFEQGEIGYTRDNQGVGLGLSIAYGLTKLLGGNFHIKTLLNSGTKVQIQFPLFRARTID